MANPEIRGALEALHPIGRLGQAAEVAAAALFLGDDFSSVTATALAVDGGTPLSNRVGEASRIVEGDGVEAATVYAGVKERRMQIERPQHPELRRSLSLWQLVVTGVGIVIGAGIYVLVGEAAADAGGLLWLSFVIAGVLAALTALSYAELAGLFPTAGAEYEFARHAFNEFVAFMAGWMMVGALIVAAAAVSVGFAQYLQWFVEIDLSAAAIGLLLLTVVLSAGLQRSIWVSVLLVTLQVGGLILVIVAGVPGIGDESVSRGAGVGGVMSAAALVFFAFIGFDEVATLAEETKEPSRTVPRALLLALGISTLLYVLVGIAAVSAVGADALGQSSQPLGLVLDESMGGRAGDVVALIAIASTTNTTLLVLTAATRMIFSRREEARCRRSSFRPFDGSTRGTDERAAAVLHLAGGVGPGSDHDCSGHWRLVDRTVRRTQAGRPCAEVVAADAATTDSPALALGREHERSRHLATLESCERAVCPFEGKVF